MNRKKLCERWTAVGLLLFVVGCGGGSTESMVVSTTSTSTASSPQSGNSSALQGVVKIDGSSTVFPISEAAASAFHEKYVNVDITVGKKGTGGGMSEFVKGEIDIADASRPMKPSELGECKKNGIRFMELPVAYDGVTVCVHPENDFLSEITIDDLRRIYSAEIAPKTWKDLRADFPSEPIKIFMPGTDSGTFDFFKEVVIGKEGKIRSDVTPSEEDLVLVNGIAAEKFSIGFFGASYYFENRDRVKAVKIVDPKTSIAVEPSIESIEQATYSPLGRPLFIYVNTQSVRRPEARRFVEYYIDNAQQICAAAKCVPLPKSIYATVRQRFDERAEGSYCYDAEGRARSGQLAELYVEANRIPLP
jgi:phosphate transport system substrate-binding protein